MENSSSHRLLKEILGRVRSDIDLEVIANQLISRGLLDGTNYYFQPMGTFRRGYKRDLDGVDIIEGRNEKRPACHLRINREGLYDMLPEGLFHTNLRKNSYIDTEESVRELKIHKEEEKNARKFFLPIEQEFFRNRLIIEKKEQSVATGFRDQTLIEIFSEFWGLPPLPDALKINLLYLIPLASVIVGNLDLTKQVYELVLGESVKFEQDQSLVDYFGDYPGLSETCLGEDFILDAEMEDPLVQRKVVIGPLQKSGNLTEFIGGDNFKVLLDTLESYFIPLDTTLSYEIVPAQQQEQFELNEEEHVGRLSYSTVI